MKSFKYCLRVTRELLCEGCWKTAIDVFVGGGVECFRLLNDKAENEYEYENGDGNKGLRAIVRI